MTSPSAVRIGSQRPRLWSLPVDRRDSVAAEVVDLAEMAGLHLDDWQQWVLDGAMSMRGDGRWSAFEVAVLVSRQCGKGSILEARQLAGLTILGESLQVHTSHEFKTCFEHFLRMVALVESCQEIDRQVARIRRGAGEQSIEMKGGQRLRFIARSNASGRGMSGDAVYLDEAFALTAPMMGALLPTMSARDNPQLWYTSSAPLATSEVLHSVRDRGVAGGSPRLFFAEWSAAEGVDPTDRDAWYEAVPALGIRISEDFIAAELDALASTPDEFIRERLGVPDAPDAVVVTPKLPPDAWASTAITVDAAPDVQPGEPSLCWAVSLDGEWSTIGIGHGAIDDAYVEVIEHRRGQAWLPSRLVELIEQWDPIAIGANNAGPTAASVPNVMVALSDTGISTDRLHLFTMAEWKTACGGLFAAVREGQVCHPEGQAPLDAAVAAAPERKLGDGFAWDARATDVPLSPLDVVTAARALLPVDAPAVPAPVFAY